VETLNPISPALQDWRFLTTPPLSGEENMRQDAELLQRVESGDLPPTFRFFQFKTPTVSFGRLQKRGDILSLAAQEWTLVQRPTGGGVVFHKNDLCFSLCWPHGSGPLPKRPQEQYRWIHSIVFEALAEKAPVRMAACCDAVKPSDPFATRTCFQNPVVYDLLIDHQKIVGGALRCTRRATLYQGSLQMPVSPELKTRLDFLFKTRLTPGA